MLLSSGVVWRYRSFEEFRRQCRAGGRRRGFFDLRRRGHPGQAQHPSRSQQIDPVLHRQDDRDQNDQRYGERNRRRLRQLPFRRQTG